MRKAVGDNLNVEKIIVRGFPAYCVGLVVECFSLRSGLFIIFQVVPPDGGWGWVVVVAAFICILIMDGISNTFGLLIPVFQNEFNASVSQISLINSLFTGFYFIFAPVASSLSNRFGFRPVIIAGSVISSFGLAVTVLTNSVQFMFATYGLIGGLGFSLMYINVVLTVGFYFERWRALATGITVSASGVGTFSFAPVVEILLQRYSWKHIFLGYSGLVFSCSFVAICFRPLTPVTLEQSEVVLEKTGRSMHNTRYPTAAEAVDINQLRGSKITLRASRMTSNESYEIFKHASKEHSSRNSEMKRRTTEFSQFQSFHDLTVSVPVSRWKTYWRDCRRCAACPYSKCCTWKKCKRCCRKRKMAGVRPMYRDDIFYDSSIVHLPEYDRNLRIIKSGSTQQSTTIKSSFFYNMSVSRLPTHRDLEQERDARCHLCPESMTRTLKTMFDFRVIKYPLFLFFTISTCFLALGINVPNYFTYVRALELGVMNQRDASLLLSAIGITNTIGRIVCGVIATLPKINILVLHFAFLFFGAILNVCVVFIRSKEAFFIYAALYGFVLAEQGSLRSVILVKLVGLENLTNAFGILLLFLGIFTTVGTPTAGYMKEVTSSYDAVFIFSGLFLLLAALALIPIFIGKIQNNRLDANQMRNQIENESFDN